MIPSRAFSMLRKNRHFGFSIRLTIAIVLTQGPVFAQGRPSSSDLTKDAKSLCYAFLRHGDLWTVCDGKREKVLLNPNAFTFAVSADGSRLAFLSRKYRSRDLAKRPKILSLVPLEGGPAKTTSKETDFTDLYATCGAILAYKPGSPNATDILFEFENASHGMLVRTSRCSSDGRVTASWDLTGTRTTLMSRVLIVTVDGRKETTLSAFMNPAGDFGVSPSGKYVAYFRESPEQHGYVQLCVHQIGASESCTSVVNSDDSSDLGSPFVSVSDSGEVIYLSNFGTGCPGQICTGVSFWRPGLSEPVVLEKSDAEVVQAITPQVAASLHEWALTLSSSSSATRN